MNNAYLDYGRDGSDELPYLREFYLDYANAMAKKHMLENKRINVERDVLENIKQVALKGDEEAQDLLVNIHSSGVCF